MHKYKFSNIEIFEINGTSKIKFEGSFTQNELADDLIERWIPYYECHKCGKGDYCKFAKTHPIHKLKKLDIKCGVAQTALKNYISKTINVLNDANSFEQQKYIDSAYYFYKYVYLSEQLNGYFIDNDKSSFLDDYIKYILFQLVSLRDILNGLGKNIKDFHDIHKNKNLIFVEGETELKFIENISGGDNLSIISDLRVENYKGKGNRVPKRIKMLIEDYKEKGYSIYFQGDGDGNGNGLGYDKFKTYVDDGIIPEENIFQFKHDFESSIPRKLLYEILIELGYLGNITLKYFISLPSDKSINKILKENFNIDSEMNKLKIEIAKKAGKAFFLLQLKEKDKYKDTELAEFVRFLRKIK